jgi:hypothetical protein
MDLRQPKWLSCIKFLAEGAFRPAVRQVCQETRRVAAAPSPLCAPCVRQPIFLEDKVLVFERPQEDRDQSEDKGHVLEDGACKGHFGGRL